MISNIQAFLPHLQHLGVLGYWVVFLIALLESFVIVGTIIPGATLVIIAGFLASQGYFDWGDLIWFVAAGAVFGDALSYWLGTKGTRLFKKENKYLHADHLERGKRFFKKHGAKSVLIGRFIGALRSIVPFIAGLSSMRLSIFFVCNIIGGIVWATLHVLLGYFFGGTFNAIAAWSTRLGYVLFIIVLFGIVLWALLRWGRDALRLTGRFLKFIGHSIRDSRPARTLERRFPRTSAFVVRRFNTSTFTGIPLTFFAIAFTYILSLFGGVVVDVLTSDPIVFADVRIANLLAVFRTPALIHLFSWITLLGKWPVVVGIAAITIIIWMLYKWRVFIVPFLITLLVSELFNWLGKIIIHRSRPDVALYVEHTYSFPSGHSTIAVALYGFIAYALIRTQTKWRTKLIILFWALMVIIGIGFSRLYLGEHFVSDVWGGYLLGLLWLIIGTSIAEWQLHSPKKRYSIQVLPSLKPRIISSLLVIVGIGGYAGLGVYYNPPVSPIPAPSPPITVAAPQDVFIQPHISRYSETILGNPQEPMSFVIAARDDKTLINAFRSAGWYLAQQEGYISALHLVRSAALDANDPTAPMTPSFWNAQSHDFGFEQSTPAASVRERHHARFWKTSFVTLDGLHIYVGTASFDMGLKWIVIHTISPDIDKERDYLFSSLNSANVVVSSQKLSSVDPMYGTNFAGDPFFTDGKMYVMTVR